MEENPLVLVLGSGRNKEYLFRLNVALEEAGYDMVKVVDQLDLLNMVKRGYAACVLVNLHHRRVKAILSTWADLIDLELARRRCPLVLYSSKQTEGSTIMIQQYKEEDWFTSSFNGFPDPTEFAREVDELVRKVADAR